MCAALVFLHGSGSPAVCLRGFASPCGSCSTASQAGRPSLRYGLCLARTFGSRRVPPSAPRLSPSGLHKPSLRLRLRLSCSAAPQALPAPLRFAVCLASRASEPSGFLGGSGSHLRRLPPFAGEPGPYLFKQRPNDPESTKNSKLIGPVSPDVARQPCGLPARPSEPCRRARTFASLGGGLLGNSFCHSRTRLRGHKLRRESGDPVCPLLPFLRTRELARQFLLECLQ